MFHLSDMCINIRNAYSQIIYHARDKYQKIT